jgi:hypothetical protein
MSGMLEVLDNATSIAQCPTSGGRGDGERLAFGVALAEGSTRQAKHEASGAAITIQYSIQPGLASELSERIDPITSATRQRRRDRRTGDCDGTPTAIAGVEPAGVHPHGPAQGVQPQAPVWPVLPAPGAGLPPDTHDSISRGALPTRESPPLGSTASADNMDWGLVPGVSAIGCSIVASGTEKIPVKITHQETHFGSSQFRNVKTALPSASPDVDGSLQPGLRVGGPTPSQQPPSASGSVNSEAVPTKVDPVPSHDASPARTDTAVGPAGVQILDAIFEGRLPTGERRAGAIDHSAPRPEEQMPGRLLRVIRLQLSPSSLGLVNVVLATNEASLRIRLEVEHAEMAGGLERDRAQLVERLTAAGYHVDDLVVGRMATLETGPAASGQDTVAQGASRHSMFGGSDQMHRGARPWEGGQAGFGKEGSGVGPSAALSAPVVAAGRPSSIGRWFLGRLALRSV